MSRQEHDTVEYVAQFGGDRPRDIRDWAAKKRKKKKHQQQNSMADGQMASIADPNSAAWSASDEQSASSGLSLLATSASDHAVAD